MAKTNFSKVEEILDKNLTKMAADQLLNQTDKKGTSSSKKISESQKQLISHLKHELTHLSIKDEESSKIGITKNELKHLISHPQDLTKEEWQSLDQIHKKIAAFQEELKQKLPKIDNEALVESQRKKHITKRFNINDKWLPLQ